MVTTLVVAACLWTAVGIGITVFWSRLQRLTERRFDTHVKSALGLLEDIPCHCQRKHADSEPTVHTTWACFPKREMINDHR